MDDSVHSSVAQDSLKLPARRRNSGGVAARSSLAQVVTRRAGVKDDEGGLDVSALKDVKSWLFRTTADHDHKHSPPGWLHPEHTSVKVWWWLVTLVETVSSIFTPAAVAFFPNSYVWVNVVIGSVFLSDAVVHFFTGAIVEKTGQVLFDRRVAASVYLKGQFIPDCLAAVPLITVLIPLARGEDLSPVENGLRLMFLIKGVRMVQLVKIVSSWHRLNELTKLLLGMVSTVSIVCHTLGCIWYYIAVLDTSHCPSVRDPSNVSSSWSSSTSFFLNNCPWTIRNGFVPGHTAWELYTASVYWAATTVTTVGYGDISGHTVPEQVFAMVAMVIGAIYWAYIMGAVKQLVMSVDVRGAALRRKMAGVNAFVRDKGLQLDLAKRVRAHLKHQYLTSKWVTYDSSQVVDNLPSSLRIQVILWVERKNIEKIKWLHGKEEVIIAEIAVLLQPRNYRARDFIFRAGAKADELYFLTHGKVLLKQRDVGMVADVELGQPFGALELFTPRKVRTFEARARTEVKCAALEGHHLNSIARKRPELVEELLELCRTRWEKNAVRTHSSLDSTVTSEYKHDGLPQEAKMELGEELMDSAFLEAETAPANSEVPPAASNEGLKEESAAAAAAAAILPSVPEAEAPSATDSVAAPASARPVRRNSASLLFSGRDPAPGPVPTTESAETTSPAEPVPQAAAPARGLGRNASSKLFNSAAANASSVAKGAAEPGKAAADEAAVVPLGGARAVARAPPAEAAPAAAGSPVSAAADVTVLSSAALDGLVESVVDAIVTAREDDLLAELHGAIEDVFLQGRHMVEVG